MQLITNAAATNTATIADSWQDLILKACCRSFALAEVNRLRCDQWMNLERAEREWVSEWVRSSREVEQAQASGRLWTAGLESDECSRSHQGGVDIVLPFHLHGRPLIRSGNASSPVFSSHVSDEWWVNNYIAGPVQEGRLSTGTKLTSLRICLPVSFCISSQQPHCNYTS